MRGKEGNHPWVWVTGANTWCSIYGWLGLTINEVHTSESCSKWWRSVQTVTVMPSNKALKAQHTWHQVVRITARRARFLQLWVPWLEDFMSVFNWFVVKIERAWDLRRYVTYVALTAATHTHTHTYMHSCQLSGERLIWSDSCCTADALFRAKRLYRLCSVPSCLCVAHFARAPAGICGLVSTVQFENAFQVPMRPIMMDLTKQTHSRMAHYFACCRNRQIWTNTRERRRRERRNWTRNAKPEIHRFNLWFQSTTKSERPNR